MNATLRWRVYVGTHLIAAIPGSRFATADDVARHIRGIPSYAGANLIVRRFGAGPVETTTHAPEEQAA